MINHIAILGGLSLAFILAACGGGEQPQPTPTPSPVVERPSPTPKPTPEPTPTPEPAETLAFIRDGDIWLIDADVSNERQLTDLGDVQSFSWVSSTEVDAVTGEDRSGHLLVDLAGNVRELSFRASGSWSRDGRLYVVPVDQEILVFDRDGGEVARLQTELLNPFEEAFKQECVQPQLVFGQPMFSPNGETLWVPISCEVLRGTGGLAAPIYEVTMEGKVKGRLDLEPVNVEFGPASPGAISPDGTRIAQGLTWKNGLCPPQRYLSVSAARGGGKKELTLRAIVELQQQEPRQVTFGGPGGFDWSPRSDAIVVSFDVGTCDLDAEPEQQFRAYLAGLYILRADGSGEEKLIDGPTAAPRWSPTGQFVAYVIQEGDAATIRIFDLTSRQVVDLAEGSQPAWQPQP